MVMKEEEGEEEEEEVIVTLLTHYIFREKLYTDRDGYLTHNDKI